MHWTSSAANRAKLLWEILSYAHPSTSSIHHLTINSAEWHYKRSFTIKLCDAAIQIRNYCMSSSAWMITDYDVYPDISGRKEYFDVNVSVKHLCFMLYVDCTCNYAPLQVCRNVQKPTIRARNRFQPREKTFIIIPTFESECPGFFKCGNIWKNEDFVLHKSLLFNWEVTMQHHS